MTDSGIDVGIPANKSFDGFTRHSHLTIYKYEHKMRPVEISDRNAPTGWMYSTADSYALENGCKVRLCNKYKDELPGSQFDYKQIYHPTPRMEKYLDQAVTELIRELKKSGHMMHTPCREEVHDWIEGRPYDQNEKERLKKMCDQYYLEAHPLNLRYSMFMKKEIYPEPKVARMICNSSKDLKWMFGTAQAEIQDDFFHLPCTVKHIPVTERAKYIEEMMRGGKYFYATDHTSFESSQTEPLLERTEWRVLKELSKDDIGQKMVSFYKQDHKIWSKYFKVTLPAMRSSGDVDTSFGNSIVNLTTFGAYALSKGNRNWMKQILVEGDDAIFYLDKNYDDYQEVLATFGLRVKLLKSSDYRDLEFLSMKFDNLGNRKLDILRRCAQLFVNINDRHDNTIFQEKVLSLFADFGVPWETEGFDATMIVDNDQYHAYKYNVTRTSKKYLEVTAHFEHIDWGISYSTAELMKKYYKNEDFVGMIEQLILYEEPWLYPQWQELQMHTLHLLC